MKASLLKACLVAFALVDAATIRAEAPDTGPAVEPPAAEAPKNALSPDFVLIPGGEFMMGDALDGMKDAPRRKVMVSAFLMQKHLVTKAQWDEVREWAVEHGYTDLAEGDGKAANHPVLGVSWYDVVKWCNAKSEKESLSPCYFSDARQKTVYRLGKQELDKRNVKWNATGYRLPTEAEWEKAARGGLDGKRFPWGDTISHKDANFSNEGGEAYQTGSTGFHPDHEKDTLPYTSPVGSFPANGYGLHDMAGNVFEWCWDDYSFYPKSSEPDPRGGFGSMERVFRGGSWENNAAFCRVAYRGAYGPSYRHDYPGFRPVQNANH